MSSPSSSSSSSSYAPTTASTNSFILNTHARSPFEVVDQAVEAQEVLRIVKGAFHQPNLRSFLSQTNSEQITLKKKIKEKLKQLYGGNHVLSFLQQLEPFYRKESTSSSSVSPQSSHNLISTLTNPAMLDLSEQELDILLKSNGIYGDCKSNENNAREQFLRELSRADWGLLKPTIDTDSQPAEIVETTTLLLSKLLHNAIIKNKPNLTRYLIEKKRVNINNIISDYRAATLKTVKLIYQSSQNIQDLENAFTIFGVILENRRPISLFEFATALNTTVK